MAARIAEFRGMDHLEVPPFRPYPLLRGGHAQTLAGVYMPGRMVPYAAQQHIVTLADGDRIVLHDDRPPDWQPGSRVVLMIHGLAGCHGSPYMRRTAYKLNQRGVRAVRMDLRGCGAGFGLAKLPYHSGRSEDAYAAIEFLAELCPGSPVTLAGVSLGGNIALKLMGEIGDAPPGGLDSAIAVSPPVDLLACVQKLRCRSNRMYDRHFLKALTRDVALRRQHFGEATVGEVVGQPRRLWEFDDCFTAPVCGFGTADNYYATCSSAKFIPSIRLPTLIISSADDPLVPMAPLERLERAPSTQIHVTRHGGHLGFISRRGIDPDRRWIDWRVLDWVTHVSRQPANCTA